MFTGIVEDIGTIVKINRHEKAAELQIKSQLITSDVQLGDSIAVNGTCLTVTRFEKEIFSVDAVPETMKKSNLTNLSIGSKVNLERAVKAETRLGGHMVSGHIDTVGTITNIKKEENAIWFTVQLSDDYIKYLIPKGSVAIDGISLTVVHVTENEFDVSVIPHSLQNTTLLHRKKGDTVNIECDMIAKYIERFVSYKSSENSKKDISMDFLKENGFY